MLPGLIATVVADLGSKILFITGSSALTLFLAMPVPEVRTKETHYLPSFCAIPLSYNKGVFFIQCLMLIMVLSFLFIIAFPIMIIIGGAYLVVMLAILIA